MRKGDGTVNWSTCMEFLSFTMIAFVRLRHGTLLLTMLWWFVSHFTFRLLQLALRATCQSDLDRGVFSLSVGYTFVNRGLLHVSDQLCLLKSGSSLWG